MAQRGRPPSGGRTKPEAITIRVGRLERYMLELAARAGRQTLSSFVEDAAFARVGDALGEASPELRVTQVAVEKLWAEDESERLVRLATTAPILLDTSERTLWRAIEARTDVWKSDGKGGRALDLAALRAKFDDIRASIISTRVGTAVAAGSPALLLERAAMESPDVRVSLAEALDATRELDDINAGLRKAAAQKVAKPRSRAKKA